jgi:membrane protease YdiL (CAAX protease family)
MLLTVQVAYVAILVLIIEREGVNAGKYGFLWPRESGSYFWSCSLLAVFYSIVAIFIPGIFSGYIVAPPAPVLQIFSAILPAFVTSLASETVFRGYVQRKLTKICGFPLSLLATSVISAFYAVPLLSFDPFHYAYQFLSFLALGLFLGVLFYRTRTLLCPVIFYFAVILIKLLTPVEPIASDYAKLLFGFAALGLSVLMLSVLTVKKGTRHQSMGYV